MSLRNTIRYQASGGDSELRSYAEGEGLTIESHDGGSYVVAWSARVPARRFLEALERLVDAGAETQLSPAADGRSSIRFDEALSFVDAAPRRYHFIAIDTAGESFTWDAADPEAEGAYPDVPGEVGVVFSKFDRAEVASLIESTATPRVKRDIRNVLASAERLTGSGSPASA